MMPKQPAYKRVEKLLEKFDSLSLSELLDLQYGLDRLIERREASGELDKPAPASEPARTRRLEYVRCGKSNCHICADGPAHGPYEREYWREDGKLKSKYIGKPKSKK